MATAGRHTPLPSAKDAMSTDLYNTLKGEIETRDWADGQAEMSALADIYEGRLPQKFESFFPKNSPRHMMNLVRLAWDDLATSVGRVPEFRSETKNDTALELKRAGIHEKAAHYHLRNAEPSGPSFMWELAWSLIGYGRAVAIVKPDHETNRPILALKDPRHAYPRAKRQSGGRILELADIIFKYEIPTKTAEAMGLATVAKDSTFGVKGNPNDTTDVIEYIDDTQWVLVSEGGTVIRHEHSLGMVPAYVFQSFAPNQAWGLSLFKDQVSFMVAISRLMSQKLAFADQMIAPMMWVKGHEGKIQIGPHTINRLSPQGEMGIVAPPQNLQVDQDIAVLERFSRILNRNPEARMGEVQGKGAYTSAKTLEQLGEAIDTTIGKYWDIIGVGLQHLFKAVFTMDAKMWPDEQRSVVGEKDDKGNLLSFKPVDFESRTFIRVDYGFGIGGYQGFLQHLQAKEAGTMTQRQATEAMPGISDVDETLRQIELEQLDAAGMANFANLAAQGQLDQVVWAKIRKQMAEDRLPLADAVLEYEQELQAQAEQAAPSPDVQGMTAPPEGAPMEAEEAPQPAGVAPSMLR